MAKPRRMMADHFRRAWAIVQYIADNPGASRRGLAETFSLSERQIQADLNEIRVGMGLPLVRRYGYRFADEGGAALSTGLTMQDVLLLADSLTGQSTAMRELRQKLSALAPIHLRPLAAQILVSPRRGIFLAIAEAMLAEQPPRIRLYVQRAHESWAPVVQPELIFRYLGQWFVMGLADGIERDRVYSLDDVVSVEAVAIRVERKTRGAA